MNERELDALPDRAVVLDADTVPWQKRTGEWEYAHLRYSTAELVKHHHPFTLLHPVLEPDHSMCARLHEVETPDGRRWQLRHPRPDTGRPAMLMTDAECRERGYAIPEPEPTVVERAAAEIQRADERGDDSYKAMARALDRAGLLVRDGEQA